MDKLVSIVLPVFNGEKYLALSIGSVLAQTYQNIELIIVNDCSTDASEEIALRYKDKDARIKYIKNEVNSKLPASLNNGFAQAHGDYYTWTSDDNLFHPEAIEKMVQYLEDHQDTGLVCCDFNVIDKNGIYQKTISVGPVEKLIYENVIGACFLYTAEVAKTVGTYRTDMFLVEDYDYWLRVHEKAEISFYHEALYDYRFHDQSLRTSRQRDILNALKNLQYEKLSAYEAKPLPDQDLFEYCDFILRYKNTRLQRLSFAVKFAIRHKKYLSHYMKPKRERFFRSIMNKLSGLFS